MTVETYKVGDTHLTRGPSWIVTRFPDGSEVHAHPDGSQYQNDVAPTLGYESVEEMTRDHDAAHTLLSVAMGDNYSHTLYGVAHNEHVEPARVDMEERLAFLLQRVSNIGIAGVLRMYEVN